MSLVIIGFGHELDTGEVEWNARGLVDVIDSWLWCATLLGSNGFPVYDQSSCCP